VTEFPPRALFAARLVQARQLRGLSQRALGDRMGLGKTTGSTRINRYEQQTSAGSFESLGELAEALQVPAAYLLADSAPMADAILELGKADDQQQAKLALLLQGLNADPAMVKALLKLLELPKRERDKARKALLASLDKPAP
jgi:transcriptional regulator with XRE-family HTH domain